MPAKRLPHLHKVRVESGKWDIPKVSAQSISRVQKEVSSQRRMSTVCVCVGYPLSISNIEKSKART